MIGPRVIKETENYRVIERTGEPGTYRLQQHCGIWKFIAEYKSEKAAIRKLDQLESNRK